MNEMIILYSQGMGSNCVPQNLDSKFPNQSFEGIWNLTFSKKKVRFGVKYEECQFNTPMFWTPGGRGGGGSERENSIEEYITFLFYRKDRRIRTGECTSIFGFGSYPPKFSYEIPSKFHQKFPPIFVSRTTKFPSFISLHHKISESSDINQDVR